MEIAKSDIVCSLAGHDRGLYFFVLDRDGDYVLLANGAGRKVEHPKRKKVKHVARVPWSDSRVAGKIRNGDKVLNSELRRALATLTAHNGEDASGQEATNQTVI